MTNVPDLDAFFAELESELAPRRTGLAPAQIAPATAAATVDERRAADRMPPSEVAGDIRLSIRGGADARAIDISRTGILADTTMRLRPGSPVELILEMNGERHLLRATIVRSAVHSLGPTLFRTAFKFDQPTSFPERK